MPEQDKIEIGGSCHCKNIRFVLQWPAGDSEIPVRQCACTFCQKHSGAWTSHRDAELSVYIADQSAVSKYKFGTETADFHICSVCGVVPLVLSEIDGQRYGVVNVNTFSANSRLSFTNSQTNFDGEEVSDRLDRRKSKWIPFVVINTG